MAKSYATSWVMGGTIRQPEVLTLPASVLNEAEGEISVWAYEDGVARYANLFDANTGAGRMWMQKSTDKKYYFATNSATQIVSGPFSIGMHLFKFVWKGTYVALYVDGVKIADKTMAAPVTFAGITTLYVGVNKDSLYQYNNPIDNLRIQSKTQATPEAIAAQAAAEYYSNAPLQADANTTYLQDFDGTLAAVCPFTKRITAPSKYIDDDGKVHVLVRSRYPSDGIKAAAVYTDYVDEVTKFVYVENPKITRMGPNLLVNPSFENLTNGVPDIWGRGGSNTRIDRTNARSGSVCAYGGSFGNDSYYQVVPVQGGKYYNYSMYVKVAKGSPGSFGILGLSFKDRNNNMIGTFQLATKAVTNDWTRIDTTYLAPANAVAASLLVMYIASNTTFIFVDDVMFCEVESLDSPIPEYIDSPPVSLQYIGGLGMTDYLSIAKNGQVNGTIPLSTPNLVSNPVFVQSESNWTKVGTPSINNKKYYLGGKSAYVNDVNTYKQTFNVTAGKPYSFAAYYLASIAGAVGKLTITWSNGASSSTTIIASVDKWQRLKYENQIAPAGVTSVTVEVKANTSAYVYVDAVQCTQTQICPDFALKDCSLILQDGKLTIPENCLSQIRVTTTSGGCNASITYDKPSDTEYVQGFVENFNINERTTYQTIPQGIRSLYPADFKASKTDTSFSMGKLWHDTNLSSFAKPKGNYTIKYEAETENKIGQLQKQTHYLSGCVFTDWGLQSPEDDLCRENVSGQAKRHFVIG